MGYFEVNSEEQKSLDYKHAHFISVQLMNEFCENFYNMATKMKVSGKVQSMVWEGAIRLLLHTYHQILTSAGMSEKKIKEICKMYVETMHEVIDGVDCDLVCTTEVDLK